MSFSRGILLVPVLGMLTAFGPMAVDMYLPGLPAIAQDLGGRPAGAELTLSVFLFGFGAGQLLYGPLADRYGRRRPLVAGLTLFTLASIACALATSMSQLVALRLVEALGGCAGPVLARAMVRDLWERERAARVLSIMVLIMSLAPLLAPLIGGQILIVAGWRAIFWVLAGFGAVCIAAALLTLGETLPPERRQGGALFTLVSAYAAPLSDRRYLGYAATSAAIYAGLFAYLTGSPFVFITLNGVAPEHFGLLFGTNVLGIMAVSAINGRIVIHFGVDRLLGIGSAMAALAGVALFVVAATGIGGFPLLLVPLFLYVSSIGLVGSNAMAGCLGLFPTRAGTASALAGALTFFVGGLGGSLVGLLADGTALPMAGVIAVAGLLTFAARRFLVR